MKKKTNVLIKYKKDILLYFVFFIIMLVLNRASVVKSIYPFGYSFVFALVLLNKNAIILSILYFISDIIYNLSLPGLIIVVSTVSALLLLYLIFKILKKNINIVCAIIFSLLSQVGYIYFHISTPAEIFTTIVMLVVGSLFIYIASQAFGALFYRGLQSRFTLDESICFAIFLMAFFSGLYGLYLFNVNITTAIVLFLLLCVSRTLTKVSTVYLSAIAGFGMAFASAGITQIAIYVSFGIISTIFSGKNKCFGVVAVLLADVVFGLFLNAYAYYTYLNIISVALAGIIYMFLPEKFFEKIRGYSYSYEGSLANEYIISGQRELLKTKLFKLSELFKQMQIAYRNLSVGEIDRKSVCPSLASELIAMHCNNCANKDVCAENQGIYKAVVELFEYGMEKGKVTIIDANNLITTSCRWLSSMILEINQMLNSYFEYEKTVKNQDSGKMLVSRQFGGTGDIFKELSNFVIGGEKINNKLAREILDELTLNRVIANEAIVIEGENGVKKVVLVVKSSDVLKPEIEESLRAVFRLNFAIEVRKMARLAGWSILCYVPASKYEISVGYACLGKNPENVSGDTFSLTKISETKTLFALTDGMGHGKRAREIASVALALVENFYKSGFKSETIISSVNNILLSANEENFTTVDACIVDLSSGTADFVKLGASASIIKSKDTCRVVSFDNLPLGIIEGAQARAQKFVLKSQDIIVLATDGVVDTFDSVEDFSNFVNNERVINVQMLADTILEEAVSRDRESRDDKSVIALKVSEIV